MTFKIHLLETSPQKTEETKTKTVRCLFFWCLFPSWTFWFLCNLLLLITFYHVCLPVKKTAEIETGMAGKSSWDQVNIRQKLSLVWRNRKKISQIIKDYFYLPFFLLIILLLGSTIWVCLCRLFVLITRGWWIFLMFSKLNNFATYQGLYFWTELCDRCTKHNLLKTSCKQACNLW
jgi:hypothetical protein